MSCHFRRQSGPVSTASGQITGHSIAMKANESLIDWLLNNEQGKKKPLGNALKASTPKRSWRDRWAGLEWVPGALTED
eukprot:13086545-Alexandrium_andersonii.AAC.1